MAYKVVQLHELAAKTAVKEAKLLQTHSGRIPCCLYDYLMVTAIATDRILSIRSLMLTWPLQELSLVNCKMFTPEHASIMAHCLQQGCNKLQVIKLCGCNTGLRGTSLFLKLATGRLLASTCTAYGVNSSYQDIKANTRVVCSSVLVDLHADFYINVENYQLFLDALNNQTTLNLHVSCLHAVELGLRRIQKILRTITRKPDKVCLLTGFNFEMNGLSEIHRAQSTFETKTQKRSLPRSYFYGLQYFVNLEYLNLSGNSIGTNTVFIILKNLSAKLKHLLLNSCNIISKDDYLDKMAELICIEKLQHFELANNRLEDLGNCMKLFRKCSHSLVYLNLDMTCLKHQNIPNLKELLMSPFKLNKLNICNNNLPVTSKLLPFNQTCSHIEW